MGKPSAVLRVDESVSVAFGRLVRSSDSTRKGAHTLLVFLGLTSFTQQIAKNQVKLEQGFETAPTLSAGHPVKHIQHTVTGQITDRFSTGTQAWERGS